MTKETKPAATRRYVVVDQKGNERLVKAAALGGAIVHVYAPTAHLATADDVERLITAGVKTEDATVPKTATLPGM